MTVFTTLLSLLSAFLNWLRTRRDVSERLGRAEVKLETEVLSREIENKMRKVEAPKTDSDLDAVLRSGKLGLAFIFLGFLSACSCPTTTIPCQDIKVWSNTEQTGMANDILLLPTDSPVRSAMRDYKRMRDQARECNRNRGL